MATKRKTRRRTVLEHGPHPVDMHVGGRLKMRRMMVGMSQDELAHAVGLTFQQVQKYEHGANRISASRLFEFGQLLDVPVSYFFEGLPGLPADRLEKETSRSGRRPDTGEAFNPFTRRETLELIRAYTSIQDPDLRETLMKTIEAIGDSIESAA